MRCVLHCSTQIALPKSKRTIVSIGWPNEHGILNEVKILYLQYRYYWLLDLLTVVARPVLWCDIRSVHEFPGQWCYLARMALRMAEAQWLDLLARERGDGTTGPILGDDALRRQLVGRGGRP